MQITVRDARVDGLVDRVGGEARRHEDERRVRAGLLDRVGDGVEHRDALDVLAALARRDAGDDVRAVGAVAQAVEASFAAGEALDDEPRVVVDDDRHYFTPSQHERGQRHHAVDDAVAEQLAHARRVGAGAVDAREPGLDLERAVHEALVGDLEPGELEEALPLRLRVVAHVARVADAVGFLGRLAHERVVADHDPVLGDARHLLHRGDHVGEVVRGEAARDGVEARVGERQALGRRRRVGLHPRRRVDGHDRRAGLAQLPRDVAAAGRDVEDGHAGPGSHQATTRSRSSPSAWIALCR